MASVLSVFKSGADRRQQQQQHRSGPESIDYDRKDGAPTDTASASPSSDGREPFPTLPRVSSGHRLSKFQTTNGRPGTDNSTSTSPNLASRTSSKFSRNNTPIAARDRAKERAARDAEAEREKDGEKGVGDRPTEATRSDSGTRAVAIPTAAAQSSPPAPSTGTPTSSSIDPLSQHIFMRTNTDHSRPQRLRNPQPPDSPSADGLSPLHSDLFARQTSATGDVGSFKKRGFLGRLSMSGIPGRGKKKDLDDKFDSGSELGTDGASARVFSQAIAVPGAGGGYMPRHKEPPRYIRTKAYNKKTREFGQVFLAQELVGTRPALAVGGENNTTPSVDVGREPEDGGDASVSVASGTTKGYSSKGPRQSGGAIWATEFSKDGKYLAAGGRDHVVRVWAVISTAEERKAQEEEELSSGAGGERLSAPVFMEKPFREFEGHTGEILDLSWSKNNFLLSSSMDKTVRLWHISRGECLCTFKHKDFVTKLAFHPRDDRFFLAGSLDTMLRLWSIPDKTIAYSAQLPDLVTAVAFSPDGKTAIAGVLNGFCLFFDTEGLKLQTQIHVRSSRGKNAKGSKISGIATIAIPRHPAALSSQGPMKLSHRATSDLAGDVKIMITTNDSRIRIYNMRDKSLESKFKGHENAYSQIAATFSDDGKYIICGSEDRKAFIWNMTTTGAEENRDKKPYECFDAHRETVTTAIFAPTRTRVLLNGGGDPIFELCNPPPVTLRSLEEAASATTSQVALSIRDGPAGAEPLNPVDGGTVATPPIKKPEESPAYIARSVHYDGQIIVTTDDTGIIKVFRQDCASAKRKHDNWETASSTFGRKQSQSIGGGFSIGGGLGRSGSVLTRTSVGSAAHSRRGSLGQLPSTSTLASPQLGNSNGGHSDRILSWRQGIESNGISRPLSSIISTAGVPPAGSARNTERSLSPSKSGRTPLGSSASEARKQPYARTPTGGSGGGTLTSPRSSTYGSIADDMASLRVSRELPRQRPRQKEKEKEKDEPVALPTPSFSFVPAHEEADSQQLDGAGTSSFWNLSRWRSNAAKNTGSQESSQRTVNDPSPGTRSPSRRLDSRPDRPGEESASASANRLNSRRQSSGSPLPPPIPSIQLPDAAPEHAWQEDSSELSPYADDIYSRGNSITSKLTSELNFERDHVGGDDEEDEEDEMQCKKCGGTEFRAKRVAGKQTLSCGRCGQPVEE